MCNSREFPPSLVFACICLYSTQHACSVSAKYVTTMVPCAHRESAASIFLLPVCARSIRLFLLRPGPIFRPHHPRSGHWRQQQQRAGDADAGVVQTLSLLLSLSSLSVCMRTWVVSSGQLPGTCTTYYTLAGLHCFGCCCVSMHMAAEREREREAGTGDGLLARPKGAAHTLRTL